MATDSGRKIAHNPIIGLAGRLPGVIVVIGSWNPIVGGLNLTASRHFNRPLKPCKVTMLLTLTESGDAELYSPNFISTHLLLF